MNKRWMIVSAIFSLTISKGFSQDTSGTKVVSHNDKAKKETVHPDTSSVNDIQVNQKPHATVTSNSGTIPAATTSGTLNSSANPNTQFVIPFGNKRKKQNRDARDTGIVTPSKKQDTLKK